jgi:hypothetical protein
VTRSRPRRSAVTSLTSNCWVGRPSRRSAISLAVVTAPGPRPQAMSIRLSAIFSAKVRPSGSSGTSSARREPSAWDSSLFLGRPPGLGTGLPSLPSRRYAYRRIESSRHNEFIRFFSLKIKGPLGLDRIARTALDLVEQRGGRRWQIDQGGAGGIVIGGSGLL